MEVVYLHLPVYISYTQSWNSPDPTGKTSITRWNGEFKNSDVWELEKPTDFNILLYDGICLIIFIEIIIKRYISLI